MYNQQRNSDCESLNMSHGHEGERIFLELLQANGWEAVGATIYEDNEKKVDLWIAPEPGQKICFENVVAVQFTTDRFMAMGTKGEGVLRRGIAIVAISFNELEAWKKTKKQEEKSKIGKSIVKEVRRMVNMSVLGLQKLGYELCKPQRQYYRFQ